MSVSPHDDSPKVKYDKLNNGALVLGRIMKVSF